MRKKTSIAIVVSLFNRDVTEALERGAIARLQELGLTLDQITVVHVPGAVEIPLMTKILAEKKQYDAIITYGAVIRGETTHYDYVCQQVSYGCQHVALSYSIPVIFGVLTTENEEQAWDRLGGKHGHKGREYAESALAMLEVLKRIE